MSKQLIATRKVDYLGRIVLPAETRKGLDIETYSELDIYVDNELIILSKHKPSCTICRGTDKTFKECNGHMICLDCIAKLSE